MRNAKSLGNHGFFVPSLLEHGALESEVSGKHGTCDMTHKWGSKDFDSDLLRGVSYKTFEPVNKKRVLSRKIENAYPKHSRDSSVKANGGHYRFVCSLTELTAPQKVAFPAHAVA